MPSIPASLGLSEELLIEIPVAPEGLASRLRARINQKPKRVLGVLKVSDEWIGLVDGNEFAVWERRQHAMRATGRIRGQRGGSRVEAHIALTPRTRILLVVFFVLFALGAFSALTRPEGMGISPATLTLATVAALGTFGVFWAASLRQRAALRAFLVDVFRESP